MNITPQYYNLNSRTQLDELAPGHLAIVKRIKSRIIQKDAHLIIKMVEKIKNVDSSLKVSLVCNDNICSKSLNLFNENGIDVRF